MQGNAQEKGQTQSASGLFLNSDRKITQEPSFKPNVNRTAIQRALAQRFMVDPANSSEKYIDSIQNSILKDQANAVPHVSHFSQIGTQKTQKANEAVFQYKNRSLAYERKSLCIFGEDSKIRINLLGMMMSPIFKLAYIALVLAYSSGLAIEKNVKNKEGLDWLHYFLLVMNFCFLFDTISKVIVMGLYQHKNSYLRDIFQALDAFVVIIGQASFNFYSFMKFIIYFSESETGLQAINILVTLRCVSLLQGNQTSKRLTITLLKAIPDLMIAIIFLWFVFLIYAIMGLYLFSDSQYGRCRLTEKPVNATYWPINNADWCGTGFLVCPEDTYCGHGYKYGMTLEDDNFKNDGGINFDLTNYNNIGMALLTTYQAMTFDSWTLHMYGHMRSANRLVSGVFFVSLLAIGHFYLYSLVSAVVIAVFQKKSSTPTHSKEEIMMLIKYQVAKYFQRKDPKVGSIYEEDGTEELTQNFEQKIITQPLENAQTISSKSKETLQGQNQENEKQNQNPSLMPIDQELDTENQNQSNSQLGILDQQNSFQIKMPKELKKNLQISHKQAIRDNRKTKNLKNKNYKQKNSVEAKLENRQTNHAGSGSNEEFDEANLSSKKNLFQDEKDSFVEVKAVGKSLISLREQNSENLRIVQGSKNDSQKVVLEQKEVEKPKFQKLVGSFLQNQTMAEKMQAIREKEEQRFMQLRSKDSRILRLFQKIATSNKFNYLVQAFVMANILLLCLDRYPLSLKEGKDHDVASMAFSIFFFFEMLIKLIGMGPTLYFRDTFHKFDSLIFLISIFDVSFFFVPWIDQRKMKPLRTIRMLRFFKLFKGWKSIGQIISTIGNVIIDIGPFSIIMIVFFYVASLIGMNIFFEKVRLNGSGIPNQTEGGFVDSNFNNLFEGFLVVYILFQNDGWSTIYFQHAKATGMIYACSTYFIMTLLFAQLIILNLFLTILLENFERDSQANAKKEEEEEDSDQKIKKFQDEQKQLQEMIENQMDHTDIHNMRMERFQAKFKSKSKVIPISDDLAKKYLFGKSLSLFSLHNPIRKLLHRLIYHPWFDKLVVAVISAANVAMCFENPLLDEKSARQITLDILSFFFAAFFTIEAILKIIVQGFAFNGYFSYMRNYVNITDLVVVVLSLIQLGIGHKGRLLLLFRILRVPRPLQMAASGEGLKIALESLIMSMKVIGKAITITFLFFLIFAIIFVNMLKGKLYKCTDSIGGFVVYEHVYQCYNYGGFWEAYMWNYDSVPQAMINLFNSAITVGYAEMMYWGAKSTQVGGTVEPFNKTNYGYAVLSIIFMLTCSILILSVFVGMIVSAFNREEERISKRSLLSEFQIQWVRLLAEVMKIRPIKSIESNSKFRLWLAKVLQSKTFMKFIAVMIFFHSVILALKQFDQEEVFAKAVEGLDHFFTALFVVECLIKLTVLRSHYFHAPWSYLDLLMAALGLVNIINAFIYQDVEPMWVIVIKALRILRVFQLSEKIEAVRTLVTSMRNSGPAIMNVGSLMILSYIFFSVLGVYLFATVRPQWPLDPDIVNYQTVDNAFLILFRATSGENWHYVMYGMSREKNLKCPCDDHFSYMKFTKEGEPNKCGNVYLATFYFVTFHLFIGKAFVSLFIGVILQSYNEVLQSQEATINETHLLNFQRVWLLFDPKGRGFIHKNVLPKFLLELKSPLGLEPEDWDGHELPFSYLSNLQLSLYNDLMDIQFYNLLERLASKALIDDLISKEIEKMNLDKQFDRKKIDSFLNKYQTYSSQIQALEENKLNIHIVTEVQKVKKKYQGVGMFKIITWKEQLSLIKMTKAVKNRYDMLHGLAPNQNPDEKSKQDESKKQPLNNNARYQTNRTNQALNQLEQSQDLSLREQEQQLEKLMDSIIKEESEEEEEYKELRKLDVNQKANTTSRQNNPKSPKMRNLEPKSQTKAAVVGQKASTDSKKQLVSQGESARKQRQNKGRNSGCDDRTEMSKESDTIDPKKDEDIDFQSGSDRQNSNRGIEKRFTEEKTGVKSSKNVKPKEKKKTIDSNIDQLEAEVAAILGSDMQKQIVLEEEKRNDIRSNTMQKPKPPRKQAKPEKSNSGFKPKQKAVRKP